MSGSTDRPWTVNRFHRSRYGRRANGSPSRKRGVSRKWRFWPVRRARPVRKGRRRKSSRRRVNDRRGISPRRLPKRRFGIMFRMNWKLCVTSALLGPFYCSRLLQLNIFVYTGTYTRVLSKGIYAFQFDSATGEMDPPS
jgi:hypothetical protein